MIKDRFYYKGTLYRFAWSHRCFRFDELCKVGSEFDYRENYVGRGYLAWHVGFSDECPELHEQAEGVLSIRRQRRILKRVYGKSRPADISKFWELAS
jgi:hypothetical protein